MCDFLSFVYEYLFQSFFRTFYDYLNNFVFYSPTALNSYNVKRRNVEFGIQHLKSELKNEIGVENLDALDSLEDELLIELQNQSKIQKKRSIK